MKIKTWIKYEEGYLPPRCRKMRCRECEEYVDVNLKEANASDFTLAFEDNSYNGKGKIYFYKKKLWCKVKLGKNVSNPQKHGITSPLEELKHKHEFSSWFFPRLWRDGDHPDRARMIKAVKGELNKYVLMDGELYEQTAEPRYEIVTFGLGHNHGGTGMFCSYCYNPNICRDSYFSALQGEQAIAYANKVAARRGDTKDIGKFKPFIVCHMPELVKVKPNKQHGSGNNFLNTMENIIQNSNNQAEAGAMCIALATASME